MTPKVAPEAGLMRGTLVEVMKPVGPRVLHAGEGRILSAEPA
jgi:hypothetical protein